MEGDALFANIIHNIISEVMRECRNHNIQTSNEFISFYIDLLVLDPNRELTADYFKQRDNIQKFIKQMVDKLGSKGDPIIITLRLQHEFSSYMGKLDATVHNFRKRLQMRLYPLMVNITEQDNRNQAEGLYEKICYYVVLASGLGNPAEKAVYKEAVQVLKSLLYLEEIKVFSSLQHYIKQELVVSLVDIITGIRLYNKSCGKGGAGILDLPNLLEKAIKALTTQLNVCLNQAVDKANLLNKKIEKNITLRKKPNMEWALKLSFASAEEKEKWIYMTHAAVAYKQLSKSTRMLLDSIMKLDVHRLHLANEFKGIILKLENIITPALYQAVADVFPLFAELATIWSQFQDDAVRLRGLYNIYKIQAQELLALSLDFVLRTPKGDHQHEHKQLIAEDVDEPLIQQVSNPNVIIHSDTDQYIDKRLQIYGYCCWTLVQTGGVLMRAIKCLGIIEYKKLYYGFSSKIAANAFAMNPELYVRKTIILARSHIHFIRYLEMENKLRETATIKTLIVKKEPPRIAVKSKNIQTETHFEESNIQLDYYSNLWTYKKHLLQLERLQRTVTRSMKTHKNNQKTSVSAETHFPKTIGVQTKRNNYSNTIKPKTFIYGLRGEKGNCQVTLDLTDPFSYNSSPGCSSSNKIEK